MATRKLFLWDQLNRLNSVVISFNKDEDDAVKDFRDYLIDAYIEGFSAALYMLGGDADADGAKLEAALNKSYDNVTITEKFMEYYRAKDAESITRLLESEFHRMNEQGAYDAAANFPSAKKRWSAILDDKTRLTHDILDGTTVNVGEKFYSISGDSALFPGGFESAAENANCRCMIEYLA